MNTKKLKLVLAQINPIVGDIKYNQKKIVKIIKDHQNMDIIIFPEMSVVGYPLMDHIHDPIIKEKNFEAIENIKNLVFIKTLSSIVA